MKRLVLLLIPAALFAQVVVDTVIRFPDEVGGACFLPELNRLYVGDHPDGFFVVDCSTYQMRPEILVSQIGLGHCSWNWRRLKLYVTQNPYPDKTLVLDAAGDSILRWLEVCYEMHTDAYLSDIDVRFKPAVDTLYEFECDADTVIRRLTLGGLSTCASWDSLGHKLYVGQGSRKELYVYDYLADSVLKVIDVSRVGAVMPDALVLSRTYRRGYLSSFQGEPSPTTVGIVDTERDTLLRVVPVRVRDGLYSQVAVDEQDGKVYITDSDGWWNTPDTMWVIDCATDSVLKRFECAPRGHTSMCIRWVPWSNRIYLINVYPDPTHNGSLVVIDCSTDSVIVPGMLLGGYLYDIQLDPIRQRIFVVGDSNKAYVLRDVQGGVVEEPASTGLALASGLQVRMTADCFDLSYSIASPCRVGLSVYDLMGREVKLLVNGQLPAGEHRTLWDCRDKNGTSVPRGVYFVRLDTRGLTDVKKVVVTR